LIKLRPFQVTGSAWLQNDNNRFKLLADDMGCLAHSSKIKISRGGASRQFTIEQAYRRFNNVELSKSGEGWDKNAPTMIQSWLGDRYGLNQITRIVRNGEKKVIGISVGELEELKLTADHEVFTKRGWVAAGKLKQADMVAVHLLTRHQSKKKKSTKKKIRYNLIQVGRYHPYAQYGLFD